MHFEDTMFELVDNLCIDEMSDKKLLAAANLCLANIARSLPDYEKRAAEHPDSPTYDCDAIVRVGDAICANSFSLMYLRDEADLRCLTLVEWPNEERAKVISGWTFAIHKEKERLDDESFLAGIGISGGLTLEAAL